MTEKEKQNLRRKWKAWVKTIGHDLGNLLISKDIHTEIRRLAAINENIRSPLLFHNWLVNNYVDSISIRVRRLADRDKKSISLYGLIRDILKNKEAITRQYFVSRYPMEMQNYGMADRDFDNFANKKDCLVSKYKLERDMNRLKKDTDRIRVFVNKWVAHCDLERNRFRVPTHKQLNDSLQDIDKLYCKYLMLLTGDGMTTRKPVLQYDWKEPLRHVWLTQ
jgi:hypothetical protein